MNKTSKLPYIEPTIRIIAGFLFNARHEICLVCSVIFCQP